MLVDAWLLKRFPSRTLDELDEMDWPRYLRAMHAEQVEAIEEKRRLFMTDRLEAKDLTADEWEAIRDHDRWIHGDE